MKFKYVFLILILAAVAGLGLWAGSGSAPEPVDYSAIATFEQCITAGFPALVDNLDQCRTPDGRILTRVQSEDMSDIISVDAPVALAVVSSPLTVSGAARGSWYFEGSFPAQLIDADGVVLFEGPIQAQGDWMTSAFVPFREKIQFKSPLTTTGVLILRKDNPSGLAENDKALRIPVRFAAVGYRNVNFDAAVTLKIGDRVGFSDGLVIGLKEINDSRCKPGVQCIQAGELSAVLQVGDVKDEIRLGTTNVKSLVYGKYLYTLKSATESDVTLVVTKAAAGQATSGVSGYVHVGPTCPVEKIPADPKCADQPGASLSVLLKKQIDGPVIESVMTDGNGRFKASLSPGDYVAEANGGGVAFPSCPAKAFKVKTGEFVVIDISCDSGIR